LFPIAKAEEVTAGGNRETVEDGNCQGCNNTNVIGRAHRRNRMWKRKGMYVLICETRASNSSRE